jgi:hypothetical protein
MTVLFSPFGNSQFVDNDGVPAQGYTITTYAAGSSSLLATYTDATGLSSNDNPVTLNAAGRNPDGQFWLTSGLSYKFVLKDAGGVVVQTVDGITGTNDATAIAARPTSGCPTRERRRTSARPASRCRATRPARSMWTGASRRQHRRHPLQHDHRVRVQRRHHHRDRGERLGVAGLWPVAVSYGLLSYTNPALPGFLASLGTNGYQKLPSGLIVQWGSRRQPVQSACRSRCGQGQWQFAPGA